MRVGNTPRNSFPSPRCPAQGRRRGDDDHTHRRDYERMAFIIAHKFADYVRRYISRAQRRTASKVRDLLPAPVDPMSSPLLHLCNAEWARKNVALFPRARLGTALSTSAAMCMCVVCTRMHVCASLLRKRQPLRRNRKSESGRSSA